MKLTPDDPRLTAYVLEELEPAERESITESIQQSPQLYAEAMRVYEAATWLKADLKESPLPGLDADRESEVEAAILKRARMAREPDGVAVDDSDQPSNVVPVRGWFSRWAWSGAALAACLTVAFLGWRWMAKPRGEAEVASVRLLLEQAHQPSPPAEVETPPPPSATEPPADPSTQSPQQPQPMMDIRMMMRYGLVPKGVQLPADQGSAPPARYAPAPPSAAPTTVGRDSYFSDTRRYRGKLGAPSAPGTESYARVLENPFVEVRQEPLSTFGLDVDTASYALVRRFLNQYQLPPRDAVRLEELINYFEYDYAAPTSDAPFATHLEVARCPWNLAHRLVRVGIKARPIAAAYRGPCNLVFLVDVSGSMESANKLPLLKLGLRMLVERLRPQDTVAIVAYADQSRVVLPPTSGEQKAEILAALDGLRADGSTNGGAGIQTAYELARAHFESEGMNRVILCTDGDFNVGVTSLSELTRLIEQRAKSGVFLSVLGFGVGNLKDATMKRLANRGNGNYAYVDTLNEAHKMLVSQMTGTLVTVAKDVKAQVEFNPAVVRSYRLLGYENRLLSAEDFNDDSVDAGEVGAGQSVTVLYEIEPAQGGGAGRPGVDPLKYQPNLEPRRPRAAGAELLTLKIRYQEPAGSVSQVLEISLRDTDRAFAEASADFKFAAAVASFGLILRDSPHRGQATLGAVLELANAGLAADAGGYRAEFVELVRRAQRASQSLRR